MSSTSLTDHHVDALSSSLLSLSKSQRLTTPIRASELLTLLITSTPRAKDVRPAFKLTDLPVLERSMRALARHWEHGTLFLQESQGGDLTLVDVELGPTIKPVEKKRKRTVDDDADSAAASSDKETGTSHEAEEETGHEHHNSIPRLGQLSVELKEVYALLQRSTAKGKLMAEQVCVNVLSAETFTEDLHSFSLICLLSLYVHTQRRQLV
jgi:mRNA (2'-O-methyladenosine-N6-)-methyltransferase